MGIHEFICKAMEGEALCLCAYDVSKSLDKKIEELERESMRKKAMKTDLLLCYNT